jgi:hypothetical protein
MRTILGQCADAVEAKNWALATNLYARAEIIYQALPSEKSDAGTMIRFRDSMDNIKTAIETARNMELQENSAGGMAEGFFGRPGGME